MKQSLNVYYTSDLHGNVLPLLYGNNAPAELGFAKVAALLKKEKSRHEQVLFIDNGDLIQGTPFTYHYARYGSQQINPMILLLNELQFDGAVVGNHEFNYGLPLLEKSVMDSHFPWLSANIISEKSGEPLFGKPYFIKEYKEGLRVAVLGLTTHYIPNWENPNYIKGIQFQDAVDCAKEWIPFLKREERADVIVVSYHGGFERDLDTGEETEVLTGENQGYRLCMEIPEIDVLLTGHQHRLIEGKLINGVCVIQPGSQGTHVGKVALELEKGEGKWGILSKSSELLSVQDVPVDETAVKLVSSYESAAQEWLDQPIGRIEGDMSIVDSMETRLKDSPLIEFINKVQMEAAGVSISNTALFDNRSKGFGEKVTMRDIVSNYIYPNTLKVIRITGDDLLQALERSASYFVLNGEGQIEVNPAFSVPKPQHYNYDMWEGIEYMIDLSRPMGSRITTLTKEGKKISPQEEFDVVMNNYRAGGGGDYVMFKDKPVIKEITTDVSELMANYILERGTIRASCDHNWKVIVSSKEGG